MATTTARKNDKLHLVVPLCPFDMKPGEVYTDIADGFTFEVAEATVVGPRVQLVTASGRRTSFGGLYRGIYLATPAAIAALAQEA